MTTIFFIRHGEVYNPGKILYGRLPGFGISEAGKKQILSVAQLLKSENIAAIFLSPLLRTRQTAKILNEATKATIIETELIHEVKLFCEGVSTDYYHESIQKDLYSANNLKKGQESIESIADRMIRFIRMVISKYTDKKVIAVSHGDPILILKTATLGIPFTWEYKINHYMKTGTWLRMDFDGMSYKWT